MEFLSSSIFVILFLPLFSLLLCSLLPSYALRALKGTGDHRWFTILCVLAFIDNLCLILRSILPPDNPLLGLTQVLYPLFIFMLPISIELAYSRFAIRGSPRVLPWLIILALCVFVAMWFGPSPWVIFLMAAACLPLFAFAFVPIVKVLKASDIAQTLLVGGVVLLTVLCALSFLPIPLFMTVSPLSLACVPLLLIALGLIQGEHDVRRHTEFRQKLFISAALAFNGIPLCTEVGILFYNIDTINAAAFWDWVVGYGVISILSILTCILMIDFSLRRSTKQPGAMLFAILCLLWIMSSVQDLFAVIFPEAIALQNSRLISAYSFILLGFLAHFFLILSGRPRSKLIAVFYILSFALMLLEFFQTDTLPIVFRSPGGPYILSTAISYQLYSLGMMGVFIMGTYLFGRLRRSTPAGLARIKFTSLLMFCILSIILLVGSVPITFGINFFPFYQLEFIPLIIVAYGVYYKSIVSLSVRRTILVALARAILLIAYTSIVIMVGIVLRDYPLAYILERLIPYGIPPVVSALAAAVLSLIVMGLEQNRLETILFGLICLGVCMLNLDIGLLTIVKDPALALSISRLDHFFLDLMLLGLFFNLAWLVTGTTQHSWLVYLGYAIGLCMAPFAFSDYYFDGVYNFYWGYFAKGAILYEVMCAAWGFGMILGFILFIRSYRRTDNPEQKNTLKYMAYGFGSLIILSMINNLAIHGIEFYPLGTFSFIPLIFMTYALFKHNLFLALQNIRTFLAIALQIACMLAIVIIPLGLFPAAHHEAVLYTSLVCAFLLYKPTQQGVNAVLNLFIRRVNEDIKQHYYAMTERLSQAYHTQEIMDILTQWFFQTIMTSRGIILIRSRDKSSFEGPLTWNPQCMDGFFAYGCRPEDNRTISIGLDHPLTALCSKDQPVIAYDTIEEWIHGQETTVDPWLAQTEIIMPIFLQDNLNALILLGGKINGIPYSKAELGILHDLGPVLGPNIENARLWEGLEREVDRRTEDLNAALIDSLIKEKEITRQNKIFRSLLETSTKISQFRKLDDLFTFTLEHMQSLFPELGFGIILEGERAGFLESITFVGITDTERDIILSNRDMLLDDDIDGILYSDMLLKGVIKDTHIHDTKPHWNVFSIELTTRQINGKLIVKGDLDQAAREVIAVFLSQLSSVTKGKLLMRELEKTASTDGLTGVYNRSYFNQEYMQAIANATRYTIPFAVIMVDVNGLKEVNDRYGHERGDEMIVRVARLLKEICRKTDVVSRIGGDEFAALMPSTSLDLAENVVARLRAMEERLFMICRDKDGSDVLMNIRISIGLCASHEVAPDDVLKEADRRMYQDKAEFYAGRGRYR
ncbi:MAG: GGDEF domain-containing protein [Syntrophaceae bacterium]